MADLGDLAQALVPAIRRGEAETLTITGTFTTTPVAWATAFKIRLLPGDDWLSVVPAAPTVTGSYIGTWSVPLTAAQTAALDAGLNSWEFWRTDSGSETVLAAGTQQVI